MSDLQAIADRFDIEALTGTYLLDPVRTRLGFIARLARVVTVRGTFSTFTGRAHLDFTDPERSSAEVTIEAAGVDTHNARRDRHLRSSDFLDAAGHPSITFRSTSVHRLGDDRFRLTGELTVRDVTKPVTVEFVHTGTVDGHDGTTRADFEGRATLDRTDWGITWGGALISDRVTVELEVTVVSRG